VRRTLLLTVPTIRLLRQSRKHRLCGWRKAEAWTVGAKYDANSVYLAMMYAETRNMTPIGNVGIANQTQNFEAVAQYQFDFGLRPSLAWVYSKGKDLDGKGFNQDLVNYIDLGMTYSFNKNFSTYVDYKINMLDNDEACMTHTVFPPTTSLAWA
jgi:outer membrane protein N